MPPGTTQDFAVFGRVGRTLSTSLSEGLPVNVVQRLMGHEAASTTLNLYTHAPGGFDDRVRGVVEAPADDPLTDDDET
jgi:hypothetical protein